MHEKELYEEQLLADIGDALTHNQINVIFQPKYDVSGDAPVLCSSEALIRWKHPKFGYVPPDLFIPLFEENGQIKDMYSVTMPVSVNISRAEIRNHGFKVAMDDFGKGYSSLNMLTNLPIDSLKLDMAFIKDIAIDNKEMHIVEFVL